MRILIVEDDKDFADSFSQLLYAEKHDPYVASTVEEGVNALMLTKPDVIFLDLLLHGALSTSFIDIARSLMREDPPRIIILSAYGKAQNIAEENKVEFLAKPFDVEEVFSLLEKKKPQAEARGSKDGRERKPPEKITSRDRYVP
jgi:DNA-binding response OmpR family regulator